MRPPSPRRSSPSRTIQPRGRATEARDASTWRAPSPSTRCRTNTRSCASARILRALPHRQPLPNRQNAPMIIEGLKGCFEKTGPLFYFARMCSKIRLHAAGALPDDYFEMLGQGFDGRTCRYLRVAYEDVKAQVLSGRSDADVLQWCFANGRPLTAEEVLIYNSFMSKRGWHDDESDEFIPEMTRQYGLPENGTVLTDFDLIEMDEGRWYPDMWRDAWK